MRQPLHVSLDPAERVELAGLPGGALALRGIDDLAVGRETVESLLALLGHRRMGRAGLDFEIEPGAEVDADYRLYALLGAEHGRETHGRSNALLAELVSFERALERRHCRRLKAGATS